MGDRAGAGEGQHSGFLHPYAGRNGHTIGTSARLTQAAPGAVDAGWDSDPQLPGSQAQSISCAQAAV